jgi:NADPH:quinone reductase-like Zn-dependent oxidoreductase
VRAFGAIATIGRDEDPVDALAALGVDRVDVVVDLVGGDAWPRVLECLRPGGRYVVSGAIAGPIVPLDLRTLYLRDLVMIGATIGPRGSFARLVHLVEEGAVAPAVAGTYPLERIHDAQRAFVGKAFAGKLVLDLADGRPAG